MQPRILIPALVFALFAVPAQAYVGPGLGLGAFGVIAGLFLSLVLAFFAFVWMPVKRIFTRAKPAAKEVAPDDT